ncbi:MAG: hypothetical protein KDD01_10630 [Phaeodactylibacter sp.]|nr:hypothetical protein [Phaeodactylibacter sp.]
MSNLIRLGQQEHLDDMQRAYELTYGLIARVINQMVQQELAMRHALAQLRNQAFSRVKLAVVLPGAVAVDNRFGAQWENGSLFWVNLYGG